MKFNNGSLEIAVFKSAELAGGYFLYETKYTTKNNYTRNQIDHVKCLLNISSDVNFGITVMTWENYSYCNEREVRTILYIDFFFNFIKMRRI